MTELEQREQLIAMVTDVVDENRYLVLGTVDPDGMPHLSPVYFTHDDYTDFYWVSSPDAQHSRNLDRSPGIEFVIFDSSLPPGSTRAAYLRAEARRVPDSELADLCEVAFRDVAAGGGRAFGAEQLSGDAALRLYQATVREVAVHIRGSDPTYGSGVDRRLTVPFVDPH